MSLGQSVAVNLYCLLVKGSRPGEQQIVLKLVEELGWPTMGGGLGPRTLPLLDSFWHFVFIDFSIISSSLVVFSLLRQLYSHSPGWPQSHGLPA
jgi:hypothetical protein